MLNQFIVVGRIKDMFLGGMELSIQRTFKNANGKYETDFLRINIDESIENKVIEYCEIGDVVGVKGRIATDNKLVATKMTFLSSKKRED